MSVSLLYKPPSKRPSSTTRRKAPPTNEYPAVFTFQPTHPSFFDISIGAPPDSTSAIDSVEQLQPTPATDSDYPSSLVDNAEATVDHAADSPPLASAAEQQQQPAPIESSPSENPMNTQHIRQQMLRAIAIAFAYQAMLQLAKPIVSLHSSEIAAGTEDFGYVVVPCANEFPLDTGWIDAIPLTNDRLQVC